MPIAAPCCQAPSSGVPEEAELLLGKTLRIKTYSVIVSNKICLVRQAPLHRIWQSSKTHITPLSSVCAELKRICEHPGTMWCPTVPNQTAFAAH